MDLEQVLKDVNEDLWKRLQKVRDAADEIWEHPRLHWYTDHGLDHSKRVARLIGEIVDPLYGSSQEMSLSPHELYILLAACYLHDIGMQNLSVDDKITVDELGPEQFEIIRKRHPLCSYQLILNGTIGLVDRDDYSLPRVGDECLVPIALVAKAHGTDFFDETVEELRQRTRNLRLDGKPVRGELLAALLMMGDELDLCSKRARFPKGGERWPAASLLHNYKHHYIIPDIQVRDGHTRRDRRIYIWFEFHPEAEGSYGKELQDWVIEKLKRQCRMTNDIFWQHMGLRWDVRQLFEIDMDYDQYNYRRSLPAGARALLKALNRRWRLVNRETLLVELRGKLDADGIEPGGGFVIRGPSNFDHIWLMDWLVAVCACYPRMTYARIDCDKYRLGVNEWNDIVNEIAHQLEPAQFASFEAKLAELAEGRVDQRIKRKLAAEAFREYLSALCRERKPVVILENTQALELNIASWLCTEVLTPLTQIEETDRSMVIVLVRDGDLTWDESPLGWEDVTLEPFNETQVTTHLQDIYGYPLEEARRRATLVIGDTHGIPEAVITHLGFMEKIDSWS